MLPKRLSEIAFLIPILVTVPSFASDIELVVAKAQEGAISAGKPQSFMVRLNGGDYAQIKVDPRGKEITAISYAPSGSRFRGTRLGPDEGNFTFIAEGSGKYRVEVAAADKTAAGPFTITLEKVVSLTERLARPRPTIESPRIKALRAAIEGGKRESVDAFWSEVKKEGAPILEPLPGDSKNMLVTFLWKGTPDTHNVMLLRLPYAGGSPDDYLMDRLGQTDVWYKSVVTDKKTRFEYSVATNVPRIRSVAQGMDNDAIAMIAAASKVDPLNPKLWRLDKQSVDSPDYEGRSIVEMPEAPPQPWIAEKPDVPVGQIEKRKFQSTLLQNEREIAVYLPPGYSRNDKPYPLLLLFDETAYLGDREQIVLVPTPTILNNLISAKRIPPMVAILVGNSPGARDRELPCNQAFLDFLVSELLPWAHGLYNFTTDPRQTVVAGSSFGGLAAACAGLYHSEIFGNILSQSGSFHWVPPPQDTSPGSNKDSEANWVARQFIAKPKLALRFHLDAGSEEIDVSGEGNSILLTTRTLRDVLRAKGYDVHFQEFAGGHDYLSWRGTLADGLIALMGSGAEP